MHVSILANCLITMHGHCSRSNTWSFAIFQLYLIVQLSLETEKTWLQCQCDRWGLSKCHLHRMYYVHRVRSMYISFLFLSIFFSLSLFLVRVQFADQEESQSTPALLTATNSTVCNSSVSLGMIPEHTLLESCARLSVSLEGPSLFTVSNQSRSSSSRSTHSNRSQHNMTMDELRAVNRYAESTKSLSYLPQVDIIPIPYLITDHTIFLLRVIALSMHFTMCSRICLNGMVSNSRS